MIMPKHKLISLAVAALLLSLASANASAPAGRYLIGGQGQAQTVLDTKTGLTWERAWGDLGGADDARNRCATLGATLGGSGWRLPTIKELYTLVDFTVTVPNDPLIDGAAFPQTPPATFWTTTPGAGTLPYQCVSFYNGRNGCSPTLNASRCVR